MSRIVTAREQADMLAPWHSHVITYQADSNGATAYDGRTVVGYLTWWDPSLVMAARDLDPRPKPYELQRVEVHPGYQRQGIASRLFQFASERQPALHFSSAMTTDGREWAASLGYAPAEYTHVPEAVGRVWR